MVNKKLLYLIGSVVIVLIIVYLLSTDMGKKIDTSKGSVKPANPDAKSRGLRNNNPGNIRNSPTIYKGELTPSPDKDFKTFDTMADGYRAMFKLIKSYQTNYGLNTVKGIISRYAPATENNTSAYINTVALRMGISPDMPLSYDKTQFKSLVAAMSKVEQGVEPNMNEIEDGYKAYLA